MSMFASMAMGGLGAFGNMWYSSQMQDKAFKQQKEMQESSQNFQMNYLNSMLTGQYSNQLGLQTNYQDWMDSLTTMKFNQSIEKSNYDSQLRGMNTPSQLMASRISNPTRSVTSSDPLTSQHQGLYPGILSGNIRNQGNQTQLNVRPKDSGNDTQSFYSDDTTSASNASFQDSEPDQVINHLSGDTNPTTGDRGNVTTLDNNVIEDDRKSSTSV